MTTPIKIQIDYKTRVTRTNDQWTIEKRDSQGHYNVIDQWTGNRRSLMVWLEDNDIHPTREAEEKLKLIPERSGFREDTDKELVR